LIIKESINDKLYDLVIGDANFFLIQPKFKQSSPLNLYMKENGFLIKDRYDRGALKGYFRVTFGDEIQINSFLDHLNKFHLLHNPRDNKFDLDDK
jgi:histidinol-phosphate/aromatic aminotransferase/cobyric acid decarboxylase-like protein